MCRFTITFTVTSNIHSLQPAFVFFKPMVWRGPFSHVALYSKFTRRYLHFYTKEQSFCLECFALEDPFQFCIEWQHETSQNAVFRFPFGMAHMSEFEFDVRPSTKTSPSIRWFTVFGGAIVLLSALRASNNRSNKLPFSQSNCQHVLCLPSWNSVRALSQHTSPTLSYRNRLRAKASWCLTW